MTATSPQPYVLMSIFAAKYEDFSLFIFQVVCVKRKNLACFCPVCHILKPNMVQ